MSRKNIDERIVSMRFDNKDFQKNISATQKSLENFDKSLNFKNSGSGFRSLSSGLDSVTAKFSAMDVAAMTVISNITTSMQNLAMNTVKAFTIAPVTTGFKEYETQIGAIQTIMANTSKEGTTLETVNGALDQLNEYSDKTIYNFTEMTKNIGTFTAAGVKLQDSVDGIKGIANLAAVSGSTSQQASTAMYQLSQALSSGTVKLMDWNSVVNAGMGGKVFQDALAMTAKQFGHDVDGYIEQHGSFRETLSKEAWLTSDVLIETLQQFAGDLSREDWLQRGYLEHEVDEIMKLGEMAQDAATKVKTFSQLMDTLKEAVQSGWAQTWRFLIGDFEQAKELFTSISEALNDIIGKVSDNRNKVVSEAMLSDYGKLKRDVADAGLSFEAFEKVLKKNIAAVVDENGELVYSVEDILKEYKSLEKAFAAGAITPNLIADSFNEFTNSIIGGEQATADLADRMTELGPIVNDVIQGEYGNGKKRIDALTAAGFDYAEVQELVNHALIGTAISQKGLSDEQLKAEGYTQKQIDATRKLQEQYGELFAMDADGNMAFDVFRMSGRDNLITAGANIFEGVKSIADSISEAWFEARYGLEYNAENMDKVLKEKGTTITRVTEAIKNFTESIKPSAEVLELLKNTLTAVFKPFMLIFNLGKKAVSQVFKSISGIIQKITIDMTWLIEPLNAFSLWLGNLLDSQDFIEKFNKGIDDSIQRIAGLANKVGSLIKNSKLFQIVVGNISKGIKAFTAILNSGGGIKAAFEGFIEQMNTAFIQMRDYDYSGLWTNIMDAFGTIGDELKSYTDKATGLFDGIISYFDENMNNILAVGIIVAIGTVLAKFLSLGKALVSIGETFETTAIAINKFFKVNSARIMSENFKIIAEAIAIITGAIAALTLLDPAKAVGAAAMIVTVVGLLMGMNKYLTPATDTISGKGLIANIFQMISVAIAVALLSRTLKGLAEMDQDQINKGLTTIALILVELVATIKILQYSNPKMGIGNGAIPSLISVAAGLFLLTLALRFLGDPKHLLEIWVGISLLAGILVGLGFLLKAFNSKDLSSKRIDQATTIMKQLRELLIQLSVSMILIALACKIFGSLDFLDIVGSIVMIGVVATAIVLMSKKLNALDGIRKPKSYTDPLKAISRTILMMAGSIWLLSVINFQDGLSGFALMALTLTAMTGVVWLLNKMEGSFKGGKYFNVLISMSAAILMLSASVILLSLIKFEKAMTGVIGVSALLLAMAFMVKAMGEMKLDVKLVGKLFTLGIIIAALAGIIFALTLLDTKKALQGTIAVGVIILSLVGIAVTLKLLENIKINWATALSMIAGIGIVLIAMVALAAIFSMLPKFDPIQALTITATLTLIIIAAAGLMIVAAALSSAVLPLVGAGVTAIAAIVLGIVLIIGSILAGFVVVTAMLNEMAKIKSVIMTGMDFMREIMIHIGTTIGKFIESITSNISDTGLKVLEKLTFIMASVATGLLMFNPLVIAAAAAFAAAIAAIIGVVTLSEWALGGDSKKVDTVAESLHKVMVLVTDLSEATKNIRVNEVAKCVELIDKVLMINKTLTDANIKVVKEDELAAFGTMLQSTASMATQFKTLESTIGESSFDNCLTFIKILSAFIELSGQMPIDNDHLTVMSSFNGKKFTIGGFINDIGESAESMTDLADSLSSYKTIDVAEMEKISSILTSMVEISKMVADSGLTKTNGVWDGWVEYWAGTPLTLSEMIDLITNVLLPADKGGVNGLTNKLNTILKDYPALLANMDSITSLIDIMVKMIDITAKVDEIAIVDKNNTLKGDQLYFKDMKVTEKVKTIIDSFSDSFKELNLLDVSNITEDKLNIITKATDAMVKMSEVYNTISDSTDAMADFKEKATDAAGNIVDSLTQKEEVVDEGALETTAETTKPLVKFLQSMSESINELNVINVEDIKDENLVQKITDAKTMFSDLLSIYTSFVDEGISMKNDGSKYLFDAPLSGVEAFVERIGTTLNSINNISFEKNVSETLVENIDKAVPLLTQIIDAAKHLTHSGLSAYDDFLGNVSIDTLIGNILTMIETVVSSSLSDTITEITNSETSFVQALNTLFNGVNKELSRQETVMKGDGETIGKATAVGHAIVDGVVAGINAGTSKVNGAITAIVNAAIDQFKIETDMNSPSKVFADLGHGLDEGLVVGINSGTKMVAKATSNLAQAPIDAMKDALSTSMSLMTDTSDLQPTISPVIDLNGVRAGMDQIGQMTNTDLLSIGTTVEAANNTHKKPHTSPDSEKAQNGSEGGITYNQYNYSPKALSKTEIYRQTRNQISNGRVVYE